MYEDRCLENAAKFDPTFNCELEAYTCDLGANWTTKNHVDTSSFKTHVVEFQLDGRKYDNQRCRVPEVNWLYMNLTEMRLRKHTT